VISCCCFQAEWAAGRFKTIKFCEGDRRRTPEQLSNKIYWRNDNCIPMWSPTTSPYPKETMMKLALIGVAFAAAAAFATPALAQAVIEDPGYCAQFYPDANCQNLGAGNPYTNGGYYRSRQNGGARMPAHARQSAQPDAYRGGPKGDE
jgi:hypothetical protein